MRKLFATISMSLLVVVSSAAIVTAQVTAPNNEDPIMTTQNSDQGQASVVDNQSIQQRIEARKALRQNSVSPFQQSKIRARCKNAQGIISSIKGQIENRNTKRQERYNTLATKLNSLTQTMQVNQVSPDAVNELAIAYKSLLDNFTLALDQYELGVSDLVAMDCEQDPEGFAVTLETTRQQQSTVKASAAEIRTFLRDELRPTVANVLNNR